VSRISWTSHSSRRDTGNASRRATKTPRRTSIDWGVYGVPETFVVDKAGLIRYKQIGPITAEALEKKILPLVRELQKS